MDLECTGCGKTKPEGEFPWRNRMAGVKHRMCSECLAEGNRDRYHSDPQQASASVLRRRSETLVHLRGYTTARRCADCGESDPDVLVFDTASGPKTANSLAASGRTFSTQEPDLASYTVRCLNCQRKEERRRERSITQGATTWQPQQAPTLAKRPRSSSNPRRRKSPT